MNAPVERCLILGGGGHAAVLIEGLRAAGGVEPVGILDPDASLWGSELLGVPILGGDALLDALSAAQVDHFLVGLGATGNNARRRRLFELGLAKGLRPWGLVHPSVLLSPSARLGEGCQLLPGAIVNTRAQLGCNVLVNTGAIVEHDCRIGDHVHIATGARLAGAVLVGAEAHIGVGACIRQGIRIGAGAVVGAGAAVVKDVPERVVVAGVPATILKPVKG